MSVVCECVSVVCVKVYINKERNVEGIFTQGDSNENMRTHRFLCETFNGKLRPPIQTYAQCH